MKAISANKIITRCENRVFASRIRKIPVSAADAKLENSSITLKLGTDKNTLSVDKSTTIEQIRNFVSNLRNKTISQKFQNKKLSFPLTARQGSDSKKDTIGFAKILFAIREEGLLNKSQTNVDMKKFKFSPENTRKFDEWHINI